MSRARITFTILASRTGGWQSSRLQFSTETETPYAMPEVPSRVAAVSVQSTRVASESSLEVDLVSSRLKYMLAKSPSTKMVV